MYCAIKAAKLVAPWPLDAGKSSRSNCSPVFESTTGLPSASVTATIFSVICSSVFPVVGVINTPVKISNKIWSKRVTILGSIWLTPSAIYPACAGAANTVVLRNSSPFIEHPAGTVIGPISSYLPVLTRIKTGLSGVKLSSTYSAAYRIVRKGR